MTPLAVLLLLSLATAVEAAELPSRHHPVGVLVPESMQLPEALRADAQGRLVCTSCHGLEDIEDLPQERINNQAPDFLLGGPYSNTLTDFCFRCHDAEPYRRPNIHRQLDAEGRPERALCEYCHHEVPDPERPPPAAKLQLRLPPQRLCLGCHLRTPHLNALEHRGQPDEAMLKRIARAEREQRVKLPLGSEGQVTCITCHSPHQPGLISERHPGGRQVAERSVEQDPEYLDSRWEPVFAADKRERLAALNKSLGRTPRLRYRRLAAEVLVRLPAKNGELCRACHDFDD